MGAFFYVLGCRRPFPGGQDQCTNVPWKQGLNSELHCLAGDATGIIIAASIVPVLGLSNGWDITIEYVVGFVSGLLIFQALMMLDMYRGTISSRQEDGVRANRLDELCHGRHDPNDGDTGPSLGGVHKPA